MIRLGNELWAIVRQSGELVGVEMNGTTLPLVSGNEQTLKMAWKLLTPADQDSSKLVKFIDFKLHKEAIEVYRKQIILLMEALSDAGKNGVDDKNVGNLPASLGIGSDSSPIDKFTLAEKSGQDSTYDPRTAGEGSQRIAKSSRARIEARDSRTKQTKGRSSISRKRKETRSIEKTRGGK